MILKIASLVFVPILCVMVISCVSVQIAQPKIEKAQNVNYVAPQKPYKPTSSPSADEIWVSPKTASTISYFSSCSGDEPPLKNISTTALQGMDDIRFLSQEVTSVNQREALKSVVEGKIEGVQVQLQLFVFKKKSCSFQLTYVSLKDNFEKELDTFNNFVKNFKVP